MKTNKWYENNVQFIINCNIIHVARGGYYDMKKIQQEAQNMREST